MGYHVALELTPEQIKRLKLTATARDQTVRDFVTELVLKATAKATDEVKENKREDKKQ